MVVVPPHVFLSTIPVVPPHVHLRTMVLPENNGVGAATCAPENNGIGVATCLPEYDGGGAAMRAYLSTMAMGCLSRMTVERPLARRATTRDRMRKIWIVSSQGGSSHSRTNLAVV